MPKLGSVWKQTNTSGISDSGCIRTTQSCCCRKESFRNGPFRATLEALRLLVKSALPELAEGMKWGAPVYSGSDGHPLVYLYGGKDHANLGFLLGAELDDPDELLKGSGKSTRTIKIYSSDEIPKKEIRNLLRQSAKLQANAEI